MTQLERAFEILGVPPSSDAATIRSAWRALVRSYHPDMAKADPQAANDLLAEINAAFDAVSSCTEADRRALAAKLKDRALRAAAAARAASAARATHAAIRPAKSSASVVPANAVGADGLEKAADAAEADSSVEKPSKRARARSGNAAIALLRRRARIGFTEAASVMRQPAVCADHSVYL